MRPARASAARASSARAREAWRSRRSRASSRADGLHSEAHAARARSRPGRETARRGTTVLDDYAFLDRLTFQHPLDPFDSMAGAFYWRPLSRQLYFSLIGPW